MNTELLYDAITLIDDDLIEEAGTFAPQKRKIIHWKRWSALAACLVLVVCAGSAAWFGLFGGMGAGSGVSSPNESVGEGFDGGSTFMSYAGPVFPLTVLESPDGLTAQRDITLDFLPWVKVWISNEQEAAARTDLTEEERQSVLEDYSEWYPDGGRYTSSTDLLVTDEYTLTNTSAENKTVTLLYPFVSSLMSLDARLPTLTVDGAQQEADLIFGLYSGGFQGVLGADDPEGSANLEPLTSWEGYKALLSDGSYLAAAMAEPVDLTGIPVTVYEFTNPWGPEETKSVPNPSIRVTFDMDYSKTTVLSYGFHSGSYDSEKGKMGQGFSIPQSFQPDYGRPCYLIILGDDVENMEIDGFVTGGWDTKKKLDDFGVDVRRYEDDLDSALRTAVRYIYDNNSWQYGDELSVDFETYFALFCDYLTTYGVLSDDCKDRYDTGWLSELSEVGSLDRVCWLKAQITVPAGGQTTVAAVMEKEASYDFYCGKTENLHIKGYDMVTQLGSSLLFTQQSATLLDREQIEIVRQNFGFDLAAGITAVTLDPSAEHYYLEVRRIAVE